MGNKEWKVGDSVLCAIAISGHIEEGQECIIDGFGHCPGCGLPTLYLKGFDKILNSLHATCGHRELKVREHYMRRCFIRPDLSSLTEYRNQVSVREIPSELKELKNLEN